MGYRVLIIAVTGKSVVEIHKAYGVKPTGQTTDLPECPVAGRQVPDGPYFLFINDEIAPEVAVFYKLSRNAALTSCYVNESTMMSRTSSWIDARETWSVCHDAFQNRRHLEIDGVPPRQIDAIRTNFSKQQDNEVDTDYIFEIPVMLFKELGGIRYDQSEAPGEIWQILTRIPPSTSVLVGTKAHVSGKEISRSPEISGSVQAASDINAFQKPLYAVVIRSFGWLYLILFLICSLESLRGIPGADNLLRIVAAIALSTVVISLAGLVAIKNPAHRKLFKYTIGPLFACGLTVIGIIALLLLARGIQGLLQLK
jgi:hypothetical protein